VQLPEAIIFDLDDTILDDSGRAGACWQAACAEAASRLPGVDAAALRQAIDRRARWFWSSPERHRAGRLDLRAATRGIVEKTFAELGLQNLEAARRLADRYRDLREESQCLADGAIDTLDWFHSRGVRLGMATNGAAIAQRTKIERFQLARYFDHIVIEGEFGRGKPHPEVYQALFTALRAHPAKTWSVGDNLEWDVAAPKSLGAYGIWVDHRRRGLPLEAPAVPDRIVHSIAELAAATA
jgi:putative hydrolase of the HAD superfamily